MPLHGQAKSIHFDRIGFLYISDGEADDSLLIMDGLLISLKLVKETC